MMDYIYTIVGMIVCAILMYKWIDEIKNDAYEEGFDDGMEYEVLQLREFVSESEAEEMGL